jgi:hypothetical protein
VQKKKIIIAARGGRTLRWIREKSSLGDVAWLEQSGDMDKPAKPLYRRSGAKVGKDGSKALHRGGDEVSEARKRFRHVAFGWPLDAIINLPRKFYQVYSILQ